MCKFCYEILGPTIPHTEADCALKQSTVCPICGPCTHFLSECPKRGKQGPFSTDPIEHPVEPTPKLYPVLMGDTNSGYLEYQKIHKLELQSRIEKNRSIVEDHLKTRGYRLVHPPKPVVKLLQASETNCGLSHGGNHICVLTTPSKKKIVIRRK
jgi:hypothetical protein